MRHNICKNHDFQIQVQTGVKTKESCDVLPKYKINGEKASKESKKPDSFLFSADLASHAGVFKGARFSSLPTNACSTEDNFRFPSLANHIVLSNFCKVDLDRRVI